MNILKLLFSVTKIYYETKEEENNLGKSFVS